MQAAGFKVHLANTTAIKKYEGLKHSGDETDARYLAHSQRLFQFANISARARHQVIHLRFGHYELAIVGHADFVPSIAVEDIFYGQPEKRAIFGVGICGKSRNPWSVPGLVPSKPPPRNQANIHQMTGQTAGAMLAVDQSGSGKHGDAAG